MNAHSKWSAFLDQHSHDASFLATVATFVWSVPSKTAYTKPKVFPMWRRMARDCSLRNLRLQFGCRQSEAGYEWDRIAQMLGSLPSSFLGSETFHDDYMLLIDGLIERSVPLRSLMATKLNNPSNLNEEQVRVAHLVLSLLPLAIKQAEEVVDHKVMAIIRSDPEYRAPGTELQFEFWNRVYALTYGQLLDAETYIVTKPKPSGPFGVKLPQEKPRLKLWKLGDLVVELGMGYWCAYASASGNPALQLKIPEFLIEAMSEHRNTYKPQQDLWGKMNEAMKKAATGVPPQHPWDEGKDEEQISESDIEQALWGRMEKVDTKVG